MTASPGAIAGHQPAGWPQAGPALQPLAGMTVLAVEDSRYCSEALRLFARRLGFRLRRADCLRAARRHLSVYRPDLVMVDMGLPDGSGAVLLRMLAAQAPDAPPAIGTSADPDQRRAALAAGAAAFLPKPFPAAETLAAILAPILPQRQAWPAQPTRHDGGAQARPDPFALREDLVRAAGLLADADDDAALRAYLAGFLTGVARDAGDLALERAAAALAGPGSAQDRTGGVRQLIASRLAVAPDAFRRT